MKRHNLDIERIRSYLRVGQSVCAIARTFSVHESVVRRSCIKHNLVKPPWRERKLNIPERAWIAACIDCEGCVIVHTPKGPKGTRCVQIYVRVNMTCPQIPKRLHELCGGSLKGPMPPGPNGRRPQYYWQVSSNGCRWLLPQILSFMLTKKRHAEIVLDILTQNGHRTEMPFDELVKAITEIRQLNCKGMNGRPAQVPVGQMRRRRY